MHLTTSSGALRRVALLTLAAVAACQNGPSGPRPPDAETIAKLTITARPGTPTIAPTVGYSDLGLASPRDGFLYVPASYSAATPAPLLVLLHGAGGTADMWATPSIAAYADANGLIVLATESRYDTWDGVQLGRYDPDVAFLNSALLYTFARVAVDTERVAIGGFSDGANEALGIGIANAGLFTKIVAFSPGALFSPFSRGEPGVFLSHGINDNIIPYTNSRDRIIPRLEANGMEVVFYLFEGGHEIPAEVESAAFEWLLGLTP